MSQDVARDAVTLHPNGHSSLTRADFFRSWGRILTGSSPMLSIEITRECPLSCPGCYAYGQDHLGGGKTLNQLSDFSGERLIQEVLAVVRLHRPLHVSLVGGEPMMRRRELEQIIPALNDMGVFPMVVTSGVVPIPAHWMEIPRLRIAVSVDGLPEHHNERRKPATYERILKNIAGRSVNVHWVITRPMLQRKSYLEEYVRFWTARPEVDHIWVSLYTPQVGEQSAELLTQQDREYVAEMLPKLSHIYPKLLVPEGLARAFVNPPHSPDECIFSKMSINYSADLKTQVEPCVFGGKPDCSQCGCSISSTLHWVKDIRVAGPVRVGHLVQMSLKAGTTVGKLRRNLAAPARWRSAKKPVAKPPLIQISMEEEEESKIA